MKVSKSITGIAFDKLVEVSLPSSKASILTTILEQLGDGEAGIFTLSWQEWGGIRRHIKHSEANKKRPLFEAKLLRYSGVGRSRQYEVGLRKTGSE